MNKQKKLLLLGSIKRAWSVVFNGTSTQINGGTEASIDNLADNAFTVDGWFQPTQGGLSYEGFVRKAGTNLGWGLYFNLTSLRFLVGAETTSPSASAVFNLDLKYHHVAATYDDAGDRKTRIFVDGILFATAPAAAVGAVFDDADGNLLIGLTPAAYFYKGSMGWIRISNNIRYTTTFTPPSRFSYPDVDANTVRLFKLNEGTGTTIIDYSSNAQNATLANGTWTKK